MQRSEATGKSHFELVTGRQPLTPNSLAASYDGSSRTAYNTIKEWHEQADIARASLDKATKRMKKWADEWRRHVEFEIVECSSKADLVETKCRTEDPCRDKSVTSVTPHYVPKVRESVFVKPHHVIASGSSRNSSNESWISTGRIFKTAGLRWIPTGNMFIDSTTKFDSEPPNGSNEDITNPYECKQSLDVSAVQASDLNVNKMASTDNTSGLALQRKE
nr:mannose-P-dolichol utilization defect 1 protein homolog 2-like [Tanacetum cinerariifolium]